MKMAKEGAVKLIESADELTAEILTEMEDTTKPGDKWKTYRTKSYSFVIRGKCENKE